MLDEINRLKIDVESNRILVFIGEELFEWEQLTEYKRNDYSKCIGMYSSELNQSEARNYPIDDSNDSVTNRPIHFSEIIQSIGELRCPIVTTNHSFQIESILGRKSFAWENSDIDDLLNNVNEYVLHFHRISDDFVKKCNQSKLKKFFEKQTLLFIGYEAEKYTSHLSNILNTVAYITDYVLPISYKFIRTTKVNICCRTSNMIEIQYGDNFQDLLVLIKKLNSFLPITMKHSQSKIKSDRILNKYLKFLISECGYISMFGYSNESIRLPLERIYVELKFDPTHPSIKAMRTLEIHEEFKRKLFSYGFFDDNEIKKLNQAMFQRGFINPETISKDFMIDQWVNVLLGNPNIFNEQEANSIKRKINGLKRTILETNDIIEDKKYEIEQVFRAFKHFIILGNPGSGKTTLSKWLILNMAKGYLNEDNRLFNKEISLDKKIPILIPIWKYVEQLKDSQIKKKQNLLEFIYENTTINSTYFTADEKYELSLIIMETLLKGNVFVIFEGLDEVPINIDRSDLIKEINTLLERQIVFDRNNNKLTFSSYEQKEINNTANPFIGNRFVVTSRMEGNYFEEINFYIPRLTIEDMTNESLKLFCNSYTELLGHQYDAAKLFDDIKLNKDIFQLAINPQLASVIVALHDQCQGKLPERRIDIYEKSIEKMIERLVCFVNEDSTLLWSILQDIAEYLHSKVEGLSEEMLTKIIRECLIENKKEDSDNSVSKLMNAFKYQSGLLNEFGHNSFRFIHRTFQEYLAAKNLIYTYGIQRPIDEIYENIRCKTDIPNWRVPLSMAFGILSQKPELLSNILVRLLSTEEDMSKNCQSTHLMPFVIIDSLNDIQFLSEIQENELIEKVADMLLCDYKNISGFSSLKEHQKLIESYFLKLKRSHYALLSKWFYRKLKSDENNLAPCANILYHLNWYYHIFHKIYLQNLHNDSHIWNWPIDRLLRFYTRSNTVLRFKYELNQNSKFVQQILSNYDWLSLIIILYGGYKNYNTAATVIEYFETAQFLNLNTTERHPFIFYYQEVWGRDDPTYKMAVHLDTFEPKKYWNKLPTFDPDQIYKETHLTNKILQLLENDQSPQYLIKHLRKQIRSNILNSNEKVDALIALLSLNDIDFLADIIKQEGNKSFLNKFHNRIDQLIFILKDPIARCSSYIAEYLSTFSKTMKENSSNYGLRFVDFYKIYLSLIAQSGGLPAIIDTNFVDEIIHNNDDEMYELCAEFYSYKFTGAAADFKHDITTLADSIIDERNIDKVVKSLLKVNNTCQLYMPVRAYTWPLDKFIFKTDIQYDIPIHLFNCLETLNTHISSLIMAISIAFFKQGYIDKNPELIPLIILLHFGIMSTDSDRFSIYKMMLPKLMEQDDRKEFLFAQIQMMRNPYYKARALYQLAEFYDEKSYDLLNESFQLADKVDNSTLKFQILEKLYSIIHYKGIEYQQLIERIFNELISTVDQIENIYNQIIASIRLSFYRPGDFRRKYLTDALDLLMKLNDDSDKIELIIKLKPIIHIYNDLQMKLTEIIEHMKNNQQKYFVNSFYGKILSNVENTSEQQALFCSFARLNDARLMFNRIDDVWINLFRNTDNQTNVENILNIGLHNEILLTPQIAVIIDELIHQGKENVISIFSPYITKVSPEILPIVHRWFTDSKNSQIHKLSTLLLTEAKYMFESGIDALVELLHTDNDQMRYRAQRIFQHPERDVSTPSKRISVIGEKTLMRIFEWTVKSERLSGVHAYLNTFFYDLLWDEPEIIQNMIESKDHNQMSQLKRIRYMDSNTWKSVMQILKSENQPSLVEEFLHSTMHLAKNSSITEDDWLEFAQLLSLTDKREFRNQIYYSHTDEQVIRIILNEVVAATTVEDEMYFEILQSKLIHQTTVSIERISHLTFEEIKHINRCNFGVSNDRNQTILNFFNTISITYTLMENLIQWLIGVLVSFKGHHGTIFDLIMSENLLSLVSACVQKEDYLYRKITNSVSFNKIQIVKLLENMIHHHPYFPARGNAFVLLAALDQPNPNAILNAMNTLLDENVVKEYSVIGIPLIHLSPNQFIDNLLLSLGSASAIKTYEILKISIEFMINEKLDTNNKSKIIHYLMKEITELRSKKLVNYYYTDTKIPFTTTLQDEFYKAWIKINGLSGKIQYERQLY